MLDPHDRGTGILRNVGQYSPNGTVPLPGDVNVQLRVCVCVCDQMRCVVRIASIRGMRNAYRILVVKPEGMGKATWWV